PYIRKKTPRLLPFQSSRRDPSRNSTPPPDWSCGTERKGRHSLSGPEQTMSAGGDWSLTCSQVNRTNRTDRTDRTYRSYPSYLSYLYCIEFNDNRCQVVIRHLFSNPF